MTTLIERLRRLLERNPPVRMVLTKDNDEDEIRELLAIVDAARATEAKGD